MAKSFASDTICGATKGKILPAKHITLGSTIKSLTNSKKIVKILNRYGHIMGDDMIRTIDTEFVYSMVIL